MWLPGMLHLGQNLRQHWPTPHAHFFMSHFLSSYRRGYYSLLCLHHSWRIGGTFSCKYFLYLVYIYYMAYFFQCTCTSGINLMIQETFPTEYRSQVFSVLLCFSYLIQLFFSDLIDFLDIDDILSNVIYFGKFFNVIFKSLFHLSYEL